VRFARNKCMDLIVISSHGRSGLRHVLLGSTVDRVSRNAECPVLIVKHKKCKFLPL